jgi:hypothetical protein
LGLPDTYHKVKNYEKINPTLYKVQASSAKPYVLAFDETYDPSWEARVYQDGKKIESALPFRLYGMINGFEINQTGTMDIVIEHKDQIILNYALATTGLTYCFFVFYLLVKGLKNKKYTLEQKLEKILKMLLSYMDYIVKKEQKNQKSQ